MTVGSAWKEEMYGKFKSQKQQIDHRPELRNIEFDDFLVCAFRGDVEKHQYVFNKTEIKKFIVAFDLNYNTNITDRTDDDSVEYYSASLYHKYIESINTEAGFSNSSLDLLNCLFDFE